MTTIPQLSLSLPSTRVSVDFANFAVDFKPSINSSAAYSAKINYTKAHHLHAGKPMPPIQRRPNRRAQYYGGSLLYKIDEPESPRDASTTERQDVKYTVDSGPSKSLTISVSLSSGGNSVASTKSKSTSSDSSAKKPSTRDNTPTEKAIRKVPLSKRLFGKGSHKRADSFELIEDQGDTKVGVKVNDKVGRKDSKEPPTIEELKQIAEDIRNGLY